MLERTGLGVDVQLWEGRYLGMRDAGCRRRGTCSRWRTLTPISSRAATPCGAEGGGTQTTRPIVRHSYHVRMLSLWRHLPYSVPWPPPEVLGGGHGTGQSSPARSRLRARHRGADGRDGRAVGCHQDVTGTVTTVSPTTAIQGSLGQAARTLQFRKRRSSCCREVGRCQRTGQPSRPLSWAREGPSWWITSLSWNGTRAARWSSFVITVL